jgi:hypothetical protein
MYNLNRGRVIIFPNGALKNSRLQLKYYRHKCKRPHRCIGYVLHIVKIWVVVAIDGVGTGYWIYWYNSELKLVTALSLISTIHRSPQQLLSLFAACCVFNSRSLRTAFNSGGSSSSCARVITVRRISRSWTLFNSQPNYSARLNWATLLPTKYFILKNAVFWGVAPCRCSGLNRRFGGSYRLHLQGRKISERRTSESPNKSLIMAVMLRTNWNRLRNREKKNWREGGAVS